MGNMSPMQQGMLGAGAAVAAGVVAWWQGGGLIPLVACVVVAPVVGFMWYKRTAAQQGK